MCVHKYTGAMTEETYINGSVLRIDVTRANTFCMKILNTIMPDQYN